MFRPFQLGHGSVKLAAAGTSQLMTSMRVHAFVNCSGGAVAAGGYVQGPSTRSSWRSAPMPRGDAASPRRRPELRRFQATKDGILAPASDVPVVDAAELKARLLAAVDAERAVRSSSKAALAGAGWCPRTRVDASESL